jgi:hypothetical protein
VQSSPLTRVRTRLEQQQQGRGEEEEEQPSSSSSTRVVRMPFAKGSALEGALSVAEAGDAV